MTGGPSTNFHGVGIGPLSKILAVKYLVLKYLCMWLRLKGCANSRINFSPLSYAEKVIQKILYCLELFFFEVTLCQETTVMLKLLQGAASGHFMSINQLKY